MTVTNMAKKKTTKSVNRKTRKTSGRVKGAEAVAKVVQIMEVRLFATQAQRAEMSGENELNMRHRARVRRHPERDVLVVFADFVLEETAENEASEAAEPLLAVAATFELKYEVPDIKTFSDDDLQAFGQINGVYNAWPFWREYVYSTMARMGLPPVTMPVFRATEE